MENVNKLRNQIRAHFLEICEEVDNNLSHEQDTAAIHDLLQELEDVSSRLFRIDENAENLLFSTNADEEAFAAEYKEVRKYRRDFIKYKAKCETTMKNDKSLQDQASTVSEKMKRKFKLPKLEQKKFDGNVINWLGFWGQFKKIHEDDEIDADDKFQYLLQSMELGSPARELVESFPPSGKNYENAVSQLINSRPLTYIYEDSNDLSPLCPFMFISDISNTETPDLDQIDGNHLVRRFRYLQHLRDNLRTRFRKEYLAELVNCVNKREIGHLSVGDIVYVGSDNKKRLDWPLGKILEIHEGRDKKPRVARVKVAQGEILRPFQRLYPLEVRHEEESQQLRDLRAGGESSNPEGGNQCPITKKEELGKQENSVEESRKKENSMEKKDDSNTSKTTRYGRIVKTPQRYGMR